MNRVPPNQPPTQHRPTQNQPTQNQSTRYWIVSGVGLLKRDGADHVFGNHGKWVPTEQFSPTKNDDSDEGAVEVDVEDVFQGATEISELEALEHMAGLPLDALLSEDFKPPYQARLSVSDFKPYGDGPDLDTGRARQWTVEGLDADGKDVTYLLETAFSPLLDPNLMFCSASSGHLSKGAEATWDLPVINGFSKERGDRVAAPFDDWLSTILIADGEGSATEAGSPWGGSDLETVMKRVELGITAYKDSEIAVGSLQNPAELEEWLSKELEGSSLRCKVVCLQNMDVLGDEDLRSQVMLRILEDDEVVAWAADVIGTDRNATIWLRNTSLKRPYYLPNAWVKMSGPTIVSSRGENVLPWSFVSDESRDFVADTCESGWWVIHIEGTDIALPLPSTANLALHVDGDWSFVSLAVEEKAKRERHHRARAEYERRWGKWLDENAALTDEELAEGIALAEAQMRRAIDEEARQDLESGEDNG